MRSHSTNSSSEKTHHDTAAQQPWAALAASDCSWIPLSITGTLKLPLLGKYVPNVSQTCSEDSKCVPNVSQTCSSKRVPTGRPAGPRHLGPGHKYFGPGHNVFGPGPKDSGAIIWARAQIFGPRPKYLGPGPIIWARAQIVCLGLG